MKIMFVIPKLSGGGAEKVLASLSSHLAEKHSVFLVTTMADEPNEAYAVSERVRRISLLEWAEDREQRMLREGQSPGEAFFTRTMRFFPRAVRKWNEMGKRSRGIRRLRALKKELGIDCAVSFLNSANYLNASSSAGERRLISIRSCLSGPYAPPESRDWKGWIRINRACRRADGIAAVSEETAACLAERFLVRPGKISVIYNYCEPERIAGLSREPISDRATAERLRNAGFVFCNMGRLTEKKGQWHLIRAFRQVADRHPEALLIILGKEGKGQENVSDFLRTVIRETGLSEHVLLLGFHMNPYPYVSRSDAYVMTSFNEGFPNALVEAMSLGLPAIASDCRSGPREILAPDTDFRKKASGVEYAPFGILVPECSGNRAAGREPEPAEQDLAEAMVRLIEDGRMREAYRRKSMERAGQFSRDLALQQWERLICDSAEKNAGSGQGRQI